MKEFTCDVCGKIHYRRPGTIYKLKVDRKTRFFCGYNCYNKVLKLLEDKDYEEIHKIFDK